MNWTLTVKQERVQSRPGLRNLWREPVGYGILAQNVKTGQRYEYTRLMETREKAEGIVDLIEKRQARGTWDPATDTNWSRV